VIEIFTIDKNNDDDIDQRNILPVYYLNQLIYYCTKTWITIRERENEREKNNVTEEKDRERERERGTESD